ncbi:MAG: methyltransferase domain-containing protein [Sandaracinaceae bacterium]|nr:methyltransferase domain-containing protein [Sandaracinaceae bacterium]
MDARQPPPLLDRALGRVASRFMASRIPSPSVGLLGEPRTRAMLEALDAHRPRALALAAAWDAGEPGASEAYGAHAADALAFMRRRTVELARAPLERAAAAVHRRFGDTDEREHLDDPDLDPRVRVRMIEHLDALNRVIGSYRAFLRAMEPLFARDRPTRLLDLAAGHGGFALDLAREARARGLALEITATDLRAEYLALGEAVARREGLPVDFAVQDALDLSNLAPGAFDLIVCTQAIHHFPASMTARMFREAARAATRGVVFVDGCRSVMQGALIRTLGHLRYRDAGLAHDAWVSFRRFYAPEELGLLARLGPEAPDVEAKWMRPGHCLVRYRRP